MNHKGALRAEKHHDNCQLPSPAEWPEDSDTYSASESTKRARLPTAPSSVDQINDEFKFINSNLKITKMALNRKTNNYALTNNTKLYRNLLS